MKKTFNIGDRVTAVRYFGSTTREAATVEEIRSRDYVIRWDKPGVHDGDFARVGRFETDLERAA